MKRAAFVLALALCGAGLSADGITVGGWGRAVVLPYVSQAGDEAAVTIGNSYGNTPEYDINVVGSSANAGFEYDFKYVFQSNIQTGNNAFAWVSPFDGVRLAVGTIKDWTLMSNATFGSWEFLRLSYTGENFTFARVNVAGAELSYTQGPLFAYAAVDKLAGSAPRTAGDLAKISSFGAGYKIDGLGALKAQAVGGGSVAEKPYHIVNAAFDLTGVDGLWASVGAYLNTDSVEHTFGADAGQLTGANAVLGLVRVDAAASYTLDKFKFNALVEWISHKSGEPSLEAGGGLDYLLDDGLSLVGDVRYLNKRAGVQQLGAGNAVTGAFVGVSKSFGTGTVGIGFAYSTSTFATWDGALVPDDDPSKAHLAVPVRVEYSF